MKTKSIAFVIVWSAFMSSLIFHHAVYVLGNDAPNTGLALLIGFAEAVCFLVPAIMPATMNRKIFHDSRSALTAIGMATGVLVVTANSMFFETYWLPPAVIAVLCGIMNALAVNIRSVTFGSEAK